jgi:ketosteroid isomerase-like protein
MSSANIEACHRLREAVNRRDTAAVLAEMDEHVEFLPRRAAVEGAFQGHRGVRDYLADTAKNFDHYEVQNEEMRDLGDRVLVFDSLRIRGHASGVEMTVPTAIVVTFRHGKIVRFEDFGDRDRALAAIGLTA